MHKLKIISNYKQYEHVSKVQIIFLTATLRRHGKGRPDMHMTLYIGNRL